MPFLFHFLKHTSKVHSCLKIISTRYTYFATHHIGMKHTHLQPTVGQVISSFLNICRLLSSRVVRSDLHGLAAIDLGSFHIGTIKRTEEIITGASSSVQHVMKRLHCSRFQFKRFSFWKNLITSYFLWNTLFMITGYLFFNQRNKDGLYSDEYHWLWYCFCIEIESIRIEIADKHIHYDLWLQLPSSHSRVCSVLV